MKIRVWRALARSVLLDAIRRKDLWVVGILGFLIVLCAGALGFFGFDGLEVFAKDLAVSVLGGFSTIVAIMVSSRGMTDEIKNRTLYPLLARPISRFDLLFGKFLGAVFATWVSFLILAMMTGIALSLFHVHFEAVTLQYLLLKMIGLTLVCAVGQTLSLVMTTSAAITTSLIVAFGSSLISRALGMGYSSASPEVQVLFKALNAILPQYGLFDIGSRVSYSGWGTVPLWVVGSLVIYALIYCGFMLILGWTKFRKQAI
ncbi:MAG: ABC transporter permease subunit [Fimbriimonadaceae bacterium]